MNFYDYDNNIQRMTTCYSKESLMEALQIISYYSDYNELRKGVVKAINLYDKKEIMEYRRELTENNLERDAIELAIKIYDDEDICKRREEWRSGAKE